MVRQALQVSNHVHQNQYRYHLIFYNKNQDRDIDYLFVGVINEAKGFYNLKEQFKNENIHFVGDNQVGEDLDFGTYHGKLNKKDLADIYNRTKSFLYFPRWPEPQGMVVIEASMCGLVLVSTSSGGAKEIINYCKERKITFLCTPWDKVSLDFLEKFDVPAYKIASFEITDIPLIELVASKGKPVIISTGIAEEKDIELALDACKRMGNNNIALLRTVGVVFSDDEKRITQYEK